MQQLSVIVTSVHEQRTLSSNLTCRKCGVLSPFGGILGGIWGRDRSVGIATRYGLDGPEIESRLGARFSAPSRPALGPIQPPIQWVRCLSRGVKRPGRGVGHPPPSSAEVKEIVDGFDGLMVSMLVSGTRVRGFKPGRSRWIFRVPEKSSACLPSEGKRRNLSHVPALRRVKEPSTSVNYDVLAKFLV